MSAETHRGRRRGSLGEQGFDFRLQIGLSIASEAMGFATFLRFSGGAMGRSWGPEDSSWVEEVDATPTANDQSLSSYQQGHEAPMHETPPSLTMPETSREAQEVEDMISVVHLKSDDDDASDVGASQTQSEHEGESHVAWGSGTLNAYPQVLTAEAGETKLMRKGRSDSMLESKSLYPNAKRPKTGLLRPGDLEWILQSQWACRIRSISLGIHGQALQKALDANRRRLCRSNSL